MEAFLFYFFSAVAILSALCVVFCPKPTRALLSLIITMAGLSVIYLILGAHFIAISQIIVYAGAVLVLFLFVIMLQGIGAEDLPLLKRFHPVFLPLAGVGTACLFTFLFLVLKRTPFPAALGVNGTIQAVGHSLFTQFLLPFELTSVLLLLGVFAAIALGKQEEA
ncbi:MAG TPA: NADH-quinone oxidoreductase subunit J [Verrucomicrobiae bacterium]|nr:NADH-quinone oxidoreductase subunit J [Verrucomicrobiae bacterium]